MMGIIEFLNARLREDEATARAAVDPTRPGTHWHWVTNATDTPVVAGDLAEAQQHQPVSLRTVEESLTVVGALPAVVLHGEEVHPGAGDHIARHDPARVIREVRAKRALLTHHRPVSVDGLHPWCRICVHTDPEVGTHHEPWPCPTVRVFAAPYADHPDYAPEWAPQT